LGFNKETEGDFTQALDCHTCFDGITFTAASLKKNGQMSGWIILEFFGEIFKTADWQLDLVVLMIERYSIHSQVPCLAVWAKGIVYYRYNYH